MLAPTLLLLYPTAMLEVALKDMREGIYIHTRHRADLFNVSHFSEMLLADVTVLVAHSGADTQVLVDKVATAAAQFSLKTNIKRT